MAAVAVGSPGAPSPGPDLADPPRLDRRRLDQTRATSLWKTGLSTESESRRPRDARHAMPWLKVVALVMLCVSCGTAVALELWSFARTSAPPAGSACTGRGCRIGSLTVLGPGWPCSWGEGLGNSSAVVALRQAAEHGKLQSTLWAASLVALTVACTFVWSALSKPLCCSRSNAPLWIGALWLVALVMPALVGGGSVVLVNAAAAQAQLSASIDVVEAAVGPLCFAPAFAQAVPIATLMLQHASLAIASLVLSGASQMDDDVPDLELLARLDSAVAQLVAGSIGVAFAGLGVFFMAGRNPAIDGPPPTLSEAVEAIGGGTFLTEGSTDRLGRIVFSTGLALQVAGYVGRCVAMAWLPWERVARSRLGLPLWAPSLPAAVVAVSLLARIVAVTGTPPRSAAAAAMDNITHAILLLVPTGAQVVFSHGVRAAVLAATRSLLLTKRLLTKFIVWSNHEMRTQLTPLALLADELEDAGSSQTSVREASGAVRRAVGRAVGLLSSVLDYFRVLGSIEDVGTTGWGNAAAVTRRAVKDIRGGVRGTARLDIPTHSADDAGALGAPHALLDNPLAVEVCTDLPAVETALLRLVTNAAAYARSKVVVTVRIVVKPREARRLPRSVRCRRGGGARGRPPQAEDADWIGEVLDSGAVRLPGGRRPPSEVELEATRSGQQGAVLVFEVADDGPGVPSRGQSGLYRPFSAVASTGLVPNQGSTGVGLALALQSISRLGGTAGYYPLSALGSDMGAAGGPDGTAEWGRAAPATPWVLVVDDNAAIQRALVRVLARQGHKAVAAENGEAALEAMEAAKAAGTGFMGAIVDRDMPVMDGVELLRRLRDMGAPGPPALPAVMLTGSVTASTKRDALSAGALDVVSKPVNAACVAGILATLAAKAAQDSSRSQVKTVPGAASPARPSHVGRGPARSSSSPAMRNAGERPCEDATAAGMSASRPASPALSD
ncbi:hypothetical protein FNF29_04183 [Cafeteria roenbergensis]|uniref:histidine kinase n=2 Tax=Cafeteria roenbergensis TaxID=33653 RepID=A0A5A8CHF3_CAFRO|nr:hypothetical protein FNF29_04183 [Cafeteria roenbergensis]|eukprot:KAA0152069.1 hypothetical protein FNF29_04183 [Cafeteria roenbergensis]